MPGFSGVFLSHLVAFGYFLLGQIIPVTLQFHYTLGIRRMQLRGLPTGIRPVNLQISTAFEALVQKRPPWVECETVWLMMRAFERMLVL